MQADHAPWCRYHVSAERRPADMPQATWDQQIMQPIRLRVLNFLRLWVELRFADFDYWLMKELNQFIAMIVANGQHQRFADNLTALVRKKVRTPLIYLTGLIVAFI